MHPLLHLIATQPKLLAEHAQGYAELVSAEIGDVAASWKRRAMLGAIALFCLGVGVVLAGVALMLWAVIPGSQIQAPWALIAAPLLPIAIALGCLMAARVPGDGSTFGELRRQLKADIEMLREVGAK